MGVDACSVHTSQYPCQPSLAYARLFGCRVHASCTSRHLRSATFSSPHFASDGIHDQLRLVLLHNGNHESHDVFVCLPLSVTCRSLQLNVARVFLPSLTSTFGALKWGEFQHYVSYSLPSVAVYSLNNGCYVVKCNGSGGKSIRGSAITMIFQLLL